jgi:membrane fusion protein (multidrug efflux system)
MSQESAKKRQFKPGVGMPASQARFFFEEEPLPFVPIISSSDGLQPEGTSLPVKAHEPQRAFVPQPLTLPAHVGEAAEPLWKIATIRLRVQRGVLSSGGNAGLERRRRVMRRPGSRLALLALTGLLLALSLLLTGLLINASAAGVVLYRASSQSYSQSLAGEGIIYPHRQLALSLPFAGRVQTLLVKVGDRVKARQALLTLDPVQLALQLKQASDELAASNAYLNAVLSTGNAATIAQARQRYELAKSKYEMLVARSSSPLLRAGQLLSPMDGLVTALSVEAGQNFVANAPLLTVSDQSRLIVHVAMPLGDLGKIHVGQVALVNPSAFPDLTVKGQVLTVIPQADPQTDTFEVWVEVPNANGQLLPGMSAFVRIESSGKAIMLPRLAVLAVDQAPLVFVVRQNRAHLRPVHVAARAPQEVFVDAGLAPGELVVLIGLADLQDGEMVHVMRIES